MNRKTYFIFFFAGILIYSIYSLVQEAPGYMDAEYYYSMGLRIARDKTFSEPFLWNYLHPIREVPHPGFTYWMPGTALVAAASMFLTGIFNFAGAKMGLIVISGFLPVLSAKIGFELSGKKSIAYLSGIFALIPVFYAPLIGTTDSFGLIMVLGGMFVVVVTRIEKHKSLLFLGIIAGLIHMTRADGMIWLLIAALIALWKKGNGIKQIGLVLAGYSLIMGWWFLRNWIVLGELLPSGNSYVFWMRDYNDLFILKPENLTMENWLQSGWQNILRNISSAFIANLKTVLFVQGQILLAPFVLIGIWKHRKELPVRSSLVGLGLIFMLMTIVFPFAGQRGGYLHSGAGSQTLVWAFAAVGFDIVMDVGVDKRNWKKEKSTVLFGSALVILLGCATGFVYVDRVVGNEIKNTQWNRSFQTAQEIGLVLESMGASRDDLVMINNPPGFFTATGQESVVTPNGDVATVLDAAAEFDVKYIVLEVNHPEGLDHLYLNPGNYQELKYITTWEGIHFFQIDQKYR